MIGLGGQFKSNRSRCCRLACATAVLLCVHTIKARADICPSDATNALAPAAPEDVGLASSALARLVVELRQNERDIRGLIVSRNCRTIVELYATGIARDHNHAIYSVTKSVQATLVGALLLQGKLISIDVTVSELLAKPATVPDANWDKLRRIRLAHVLSMSSGLDYKHDPSTHPIYRAPSRLAHALLPPFAFEPGRRFYYSDGDASIAGAVVAARAGSDLKSFADAALFGPLGFENTDWWFLDKDGLHAGGWGMRLRVIDMVKFGYLWLQQGRWQGKQIFAPDFVDHAWAETAVPYYGLFWWRSQREHPVLGMFRMARGFKGQRIFLFPRHGIVVAMTANLASADEMAIEELVPARIAEALRPSRNGTADGVHALAGQISRPFSGKPGRNVSAQDTPRAPGATR